MGSEHSFPKVIRNTQALEDIIEERVLNVIITPVDTPIEKSIKPNPNTERELEQVEEVSILFYFFYFFFILRNYYIINMYVCTCMYVYMYVYMYVCNVCVYTYV